MSITDELREYANRFKNSHDAWSGIGDDLTAIADRIDAEHEKAMSRAGQLLADAEKDRDYNYANWQDCKQKVLQHNITLDELSAEIERLKDELAHCIELPKDADGEYIHVGDVLDGYGKTIEVVEIRYGRSGWVLISRDGNGYADTFAFTHHAPTVEDVLTEFGIDWEHESDCEDRAALLKEYASKLRLAEGEDA